MLPSCVKGTIIHFSYCWENAWRECLDGTAESAAQIVQALMQRTACYVLCMHCGTVADEEA